MRRVSLNKDVGKGEMRRVDRLHLQKHHCHKRQRNAEDLLQVTGN
jgi:hypothetical protein